MISCEFFKTLQNSTFIEHMWAASFVLGKNLKSFTTNYDLAKYLKTLTILIDFAEKIWNSGVAMKQSENLLRGWYKILSESFLPEIVSING